LDYSSHWQIKEKEDPELERKTGEWIEDILGKSIADTSNLYLSLKDGVILCEYVSAVLLCVLMDRLINKIQPNAVKKIATPKPGKPLHVLQERVWCLLTAALTSRRISISICRRVTR
jgi:hypothetical protein